jgi:hypothetical protein
MFNGMRISSPRSKEGSCVALISTAPGWVAKDTMHRL